MGHKFYSNVVVGCVVFLIGDNDQLLLNVFIYVSFTTDKLR